MKYFLNIIILMLIVISNYSYGHCQIPCGIYDDEARFKMIYEHISTLEKSIQEINKNPNPNQQVRWVLNKEHHADEISDIVTYYFMAQRIKIDSIEYDQKIQLLHNMLLTSMKIKQSTDIKLIEDLRKNINSFGELYFKK